MLSPLPPAGQQQPVLAQLAEEGTPPPPAPSPAPHLLVLLTRPDRAPDPPSPDPFVQLQSVLAHLESSPQVIQQPGT